MSSFRQKVGLVDSSRKHSVSDITSDFHKDGYMTMFLEEHGVRRLYDVFVMTNDTRDPVEFENREMAVALLFLFTWNDNVDELRDYYLAMIDVGFFQLIREQMGRSDDTNVVLDHFQRHDVDNIIHDHLRHLQAAGRLTKSAAKNSS